MTTTKISFGGVEYTCRIVKDNQGDDLIIGSLALLDALHPGNWNDPGEGFACREASDIYDGIFFFTDGKDLLLADDKLIGILRESNPDWF